jgi:hypothetical protein
MAKLAKLQPHIRRELANRLPPRGAEVLERIEVHSYTTIAPCISISGSIGMLQHGEGQKRLYEAQA